jgi:hypothetical protein
VVWQGDSTDSLDWESHSTCEPTTTGAASKTYSDRDAMSAKTNKMASASTNDDSSSTPAYARTNVRTLSMPHQQARGPCWARHIAGSLWQGESYFLQIDSHMRFRSGWDRYLIWLLECTRESAQMCSSRVDEKNAVRPIITTYPLGYTLPNNIPDDIRPTLLVSCNMHAFMYTYTYTHDPV